MDSFFVRFKNALVLITLLLVQTIALAIQVRRPIESGAIDSPKVTLARSWVVAAIAPVERLFVTIGHGVRSTWSNYLDLRHVRQHDRDLQYQIDQLRIQQAAIAEDAVQGHRLQALLTFQQHYISSTVAAQVIGTGGSDLSRVLYIDKGSADGLRPDMPVITPDGIVGKIRDVFPHTSQVLLINDQTSGAGVLLANTRVRAIIKGTSGGRVLINNLTPDDRIKPGEPVLTSGGDQVFPRGLPVGTIESIKADPDHQPYTAILVKPAVNLFQLEEVLVITGTQPSLPPDTLQALAHGAQISAAARAAAQKAAAEAAAAKAAADEKEAAARSAAEVVADRLPSLRDLAPDSPETNAKAAADAANPKAAGGQVPKPLPTIHADRYSPGTTPPATSLVPGAPHTSTPNSTLTPVAPRATSTPHISTPSTLDSTGPTESTPPAPRKPKRPTTTPEPTLPPQN